MPNGDNIWKDSFNNSNLKEEKWLEPNMDLFDKIEGEIFEDKEERRLPIWLPIGFFVMIMSISVYFTPRSPMIKSEFSQLKEISNVNALTEIDPGNIDQKDNNIDGSSIAQGKEANKLVGTAASNSIKSQTSEDRIAFTETKKQALEISSKNKMKSMLPVKNWEESNELKTGFTSPKANNEVKTVKSDRRILDLSLLSAAKMPNLLFNRNGVKLDLSRIELPQNQVGKSIIYGLTIGAVQWDFRLNNNYNTALNPADFTHTNGKGLEASFYLERSINAKLSWTASLAMQQVNFTSGHNSSVDYLLSEESDGNNSNGLNIPMASPLGFLQSDLVINRSELITEESTNLILDLHNVHEIFSLSISSGLKYQWLDSPSWNLSTGANFGLRQILSIDNSLESFDINSLAFDSGTTFMTQNQQAINKLSPLIELGINVQKTFSNDLQVGLGFSYGQHLIPIYKEGDFSTSLQTFGLQASVSKSF